MMRVNETQAGVGTASASLEDGVWKIGNDEILLQLHAPVGGTLTLRSFGPSNGAGVGVSDAGAPFRLHIDGRDITTDLRVTGGGAWPEARSVRVAIELEGPGGHRVELHVESHDEQAILRQWIEVDAASPITVTAVEPVRLSPLSGRFTTLNTVSGVQQQGGWRADEGLYQSFRLEERSLGEVTRLHSGPRSTWDETPWAALTGADMGGLIVALEYGGQWQLHAGAGGDTGSASVSFAPDGIVPKVQPGTRWVSPAAWIGTFSGDLDSAAAVMHRYIRDTVLPPTADDFPWVQYNTWFSWYCDLDETTLLAEADRAADLGIEVFYVDAGWWAGNPVRRDRFSSGLGNWTENRDKFPRGLRAFADEIRQRGMHFGIWVEPERVDMRTATTGTWEPRWIARGEDGTYIRCDWPSDTDTAWLCFGHPETQAWAEQWIGDLVEELGVRWLKWDSNYWGICTSHEHGHGATDGERAQVEGVYAVMERLRARFPDLIIENCAGGATRLDFAITRQTHAAWLNDASQPAHRSRFHNAGASYLFPPAMLNAWVTESEHENVNGQDQPDPVWRSIIRSRMLGAMGFSCQLQTWSEATMRIAREEILRYKEQIRPLLRSGTFHHLLPQPEIPSRDLPTPDVWEAYQLSSADGREHMVLGFRNASPDERLTVTPRVVVAHDYIVEAEGAPSRRVSGHELVQTGLVIECPLLASSWVTVRRVDGEGQ